MIIKAKYSGTCTKCGGIINVGDEIEWTKGKGAKHTVCPDLSANASKAIYKISCGSGYGGRPYRPGEVFKSPEFIRKKGGPDYLFVVRASKTYYSEDGLCFGVGDDRGYVYSADCREATAKEAAPLIEQERKAAEKRDAAKKLDLIKREIKSKGERPAGWNEPEGKLVLDTQDVYGGGDWFVIGPNHIWYVQNNGGDGDAWGHNNVRTGGAGAIGWRVEFTETLADEINRLAQVIQ